MAKYATDIFKPRNPEKLLNSEYPTYRSSYELTFMRFLDNHPFVIKWGSECVTIDYWNPVLKRPAKYIPDFLVSYMDKTGKTHMELIEIKPLSQSLMVKARTRSDRIAVVINTAKWKAATAFAKANKWTFRILSENELYL